MPAVVVTGASTGIGRAVALWMDREGWTVYAGVRKDADAENLREVASDRLIPVLLDVTRPEQIGALADRLHRDLGDQGLAGLVNNAGIGGGYPLETIDPERIQQVLDVNLFGIVRCTRALMPLLRASGDGRVVNMSSVGGRWAGPFLAPYHISKWAVEAYSDSLRQELHGHPVQVSVVEPGTITTEIWEKADGTLRTLIDEMDPATAAHYGDRLAVYADAIASQRTSGIPADRVAKVVDHALRARRPKTRYLVGADAKGIAFARWLLPDRWFDALVRRVIFRGR